MTLERKGFAAAEFKLDEQGAIQLAFSQLGVIDRDGDVTLPGAIPTKDVPMSAYGHTSWEGALPTGKGSIREEGGWGIFTGQFLMETDQGRNAYHTVKAMGPLQEWSYGYNPVDYSYGEQDGKNVRLLKRLDVFEVSPVLVGAGIGTHTRSLKTALDPGAVLADSVARFLGDQKALHEQFGSMAELRAKEGRTLSAANRDRLAALMDAMAAAMADLEQLLAETEPPKARLARQAAILAELARLNGVPMT